MIDQKDKDRGQLESIVVSLLINNNGDKQMVKWREANTGCCEQGSIIQVRVRGAGAGQQRYSTDPGVE